MLRRTASEYREEAAEVLRLMQDLLNEPGLDETRFAILKAQFSELMDAAEAAKVSAGPA